MRLLQVTIHRMRWSLYLCLLTVPQLWADDSALRNAADVDLAKIDRSIRKEPVYQTQEPQYCLMAFGTQADVRVWVVLDGDVLYVDRNGNGDLTDPDERIASLRSVHRSAERPDVEVMRTFFVPRPSEHPNPATTIPLLSCMPEVTSLVVAQFVPSDEYPDKAQLKLRREKPFSVSVLSANGWEQGGLLAFGNRASRAPILHFFGPQRVALLPGQSLQLRRGETAEFYVGLTAPGLNGSLRTHSIPNAAHLAANFEFPARQSGGEPICQRVELTEPG